MSNAESSRYLIVWLDWKLFELDIARLAELNLHYSFDRRRRLHTTVRRAQKEKSMIV